MKSKSRSFWITILFAFFTLALVGCDGDDGAPGPQGEQGEQGEQGPPGDSGDGALPTVQEADVINATIIGVTVSSPPVVEFRLTDERGQGLVGLPGSAIGFTFAKLIPGSDGNADDWQSYINTIEEANDIGSGTEDQVQATRDRGDDDKLVDNLDGSYTYTFGIDVTDVTEPLAVAYEPDLTHRVAAQISGFADVDNPIYTWRPSDDATMGLFSRDIVTVDTCNNCHDRLELHGGSRNETEYCVTCHNPGSTDAQSANTVDFKQMIHKIHRGEFLPSVQAGGEYAIWGFRDTKHDYSHVVFPQDVRNCRNCHDEANTDDTPDAGNWINRPTREACGACHDDVNFETGDGHSGGNIPATNADCLTCHGPEAFRPVEQVHRLLAREAADDFEYKITKVVNTGPGEFPKIKFKVKNPNDGTNYDIQNDDPFNQGGASRLAIDIGWDTVDYTNTGSGSHVPGFRPGSAAQVVSLNPLGGGSTDNGDGTFTITSNVAVPMDVTGSLLVGIEGHPGVDVDNDGNADSIPVTSVVDYFPVTDASAVPRRTVVAIDSCNACHESLSLHGSNRTDNPQLCVACHNPNATDIRARNEAGVDETTSIDGLAEQSIDFKHMVHRIHAGNIAVYGFGGGEHDYRHVVFPGELSNCGNCHAGDSFYPVNQNFVLATTTDTGADLADPTDDVNISPNASVCSGCHTSDPTVSHMIINGASFNASQDADGILVDLDTNGVVVESCEVCHAAGAIADVGVAHGQHDH
jgi:OmcA/MtrC family decaheme c-type cytochrome